MNSNKSQDKYNEIFQELKEEKMDWDFDSFLKQAEEESKQEEKVVPISSYKSASGMPKFFWMAASGALIAGFAFLSGIFNNNSIEDKDNLTKAEILKQKQNDESEFLVYNEDKSQDSLALKEKDSIVSNIKPEEEAKEVMDQILPKRGRIKKQNKQRYADNSSLQQVDNQKSSLKAKKYETTYQENYVIINGQKIENEKEAIDVAKYSLRMLSDQVTKTVAKTEPITDFVEF